MKIKFVYFDIGGVIIDHMSALEKLAIQLEMDPKAVAHLFGVYGDEIDRGNLSWDQFEEILLKKLTATKKYESTLAWMFVEKIEPISQTHDLIKKLSLEVSLGLLSNVPIDIFDLIEKRGLLPDVNYTSVVKSAEMGHIKPEKEIFDYAQSNIPCSPNEVLFVDDLQANVKAAQDFGWNSVVFNTKMPGESVKLIHDALI